MINSLGPLWDGNEVWLITAGGVTFAAFPLVYAVMFSSLYSALMLILFALILRGVSFEFRSKVDHPVWRQVWDLCIFIGSLVPALLFGAFLNSSFFNTNNHRLQCSVNPGNVKRWESHQQSWGFTDDYYDRYLNQTFSGMLYHQVEHGNTQRIGFP